MNKARRTDQIKLIAFMQAQNCTNYAGSWRHPETMTDVLTPAYYQRIARTLEEGKFHLAFFDDRLAMPDIYGSDYRAAVEFGIRPVKLDLIPILTAMGLVTQKLGLGATYSTTYTHPFHFARSFATLDLMIGGRAAWNVVTSINDSEAENFGLDEHLEHDIRYDRAEEFIDVVNGLWHSWDDDALVVDKATSRYADPAKVKALNHEGEWFKCKGPLTVPRSPQGDPIIIQAGQSGKGQHFAAKWANLVFVMYKDIAAGAKQYDAFKKIVEEHGRTASDMVVAPAIYTIVAPTREEAFQKKALIEAQALPQDTLVLLSEILNFDFGTRGLNEPLTDGDLASISAPVWVERVVKASGSSNPTPQDFITHTGRGTINDAPVFCGTPSDVADEMEAWFYGGACDGFVLAATHSPGAYEDFVRLVVPELQRRGSFQKDYAGDTLWDNLGRPARGGRS
jgi:FMN-dependent oxidoreductase (nitrilotriacetate monooxygenase family)